MARFSLLILVVAVLLSPAGCIPPTAGYVDSTPRPMGTSQPSVAPTSEEASELNPNDTSVYLERANEYLSQGQHQRAIAEYNKAIQANPNLAEAYILRGFTYMELGQFERAIADYDTAIELEPNNAMFYNDRGFMHAELGQYERAIQDYNIAIELDPNHENIDYAYNNRGFAYGKLDEYEQAFEDFRQATVLNTDNAWIYYNRAVIYVDMGAVSKAMADLELSLQLGDPPLDLKRRSRAERLLEQLRIWGREA